MYLLKLWLVLKHNNLIVYLHSTMYLLKHIRRHYQIIRFYDLHSTMYLLKLFSLLVGSTLLTDLHSTMYLLKL